MRSAGLLDGPKGGIVSWTDGNVSEQWCQGSEGQRSTSDGPPDDTVAKAKLRSSEICPARRQDPSPVNVFSLPIGEIVIEGVEDGLHILKGARRLKKGR